MVGKILSNSVSNDISVNNPYMASSPKPVILTNENFDKGTTITVAIRVIIKKMNPQNTVFVNWPSRLNDVTFILTILRVEEIPKPSNMLLSGAA